MIRQMTTGTGAAVRRQFGAQNIKNRAIRVVAGWLSILTALEGPPDAWAQWIALVGATFAGLWTSRERSEAELPPRTP